MSRNGGWVYQGALAASLLALCEPAWACGGFFCSTARPVDQAGEEILFAVDDEGVTMHVKIDYQGEAEDFAWVVPVTAEPDLQIGTDALFPVLSQLRAQFTLNRNLDACTVPPMAAVDSSAADTGSAGGVTVVKTGVVGPYETVVLQATDSAELLSWLQANGFDLPQNLEPVLSPYIAQDSYFVALKLAKDKDVGDIEPLVIRYPGSALSIPIQLTSIAATPDMRLRVYLLGEHRAVPESYLHVTLNEMAIDWWSGGANLEEVITKAADEAGGHAFFTDYAGSVDPVRGQLYTPFWDNVPEQLAQAPDVTSALSVLISAGLPFDDALMGVLEDATGLSSDATAGFDLVDVLNCMRPGGYYGYYYTADPASCYPEELAQIALDAAALAEAVETVVLEPRRRTEALLGSFPKITRLTSSVSPVEMTVDPTFVFNPDLPDVPLQREATEVILCDRDESPFDAPRRLLLSDGRTVTLPSVNELQALGLTEIEWLEQQGLTEPSTAIIERTSSSGPPEILRDNTGILWDALDSVMGRGRGCGCSWGASGASGSLGAAMPALLLGLLLLRRR